MSLKIRAACASVFLLAFFIIAPAAHAEQKTIYLTLDMDMDGSMYHKAIMKDEQWYDPGVFAYLEQQEVPATFFVSGLFAKAYPDLMHSLAATRGFSFENHSYDESAYMPGCYWLPTLASTTEKMDQIQKTEDIIRATTGQTATYFRFPGICHDAVNDALIKSLGYQIDDGSIVAGDPFSTNTPAMVAAVMNGAKNDGTIIMHVGGPNSPKSLALLEQIIPKLKAEGYTFVKL